MDYDDIILQTESFRKLLDIIKQLSDENKALIAKYEELVHDFYSHLELHGYEIEGRMNYLESEAARNQNLRRDLLDAIQRNT